MKLTKQERVIRECMLFNCAHRIAGVVDRLDATRRRRDHDDDPGLKRRYDRQHRELMKACEDMVEAVRQRLPDTALALFGGAAAVAERDRLLGASAEIVPLKREGRPAT